MRLFTGKILAVAGALLCAGLAVACDDDDDDDGEARLSDPEIVGVLETVNLGEIELGELAVGMARDAEVVTYAQEMVSAHSEALDRLQGSADSAQMVGDASATSASLQAATSAERAALDAMPGGPELDLRYMCGQIRLHRTVLETIDTQLRPDAEDVLIRNEVETHTDMVSSHLELAREIVRGLTEQGPTEACADFGGD